MAGFQSPAGDEGGRAVLLRRKTGFPGFSPTLRKTVKNSLQDKHG